MSTRQKSWQDFKIHTSKSNSCLYIYIQKCHTNKNWHSLAVLKGTVQLPNTINSNAVCKCGVVTISNVERVDIMKLQTTTMMNNKHCDQNYKCQLHSCFDSRHWHRPVFHVALPTPLPGVFFWFPSLPRQLSSRCKGGHPFHPHGTAIFQPVATYMHPHLIYFHECYPWRQALHVDTFQTSSTLHPGLVLRL